MVAVIVLAAVAAVTVALAKAFPGLFNAQSIKTVALLVPCCFLSVFLGYLLLAAVR